MADLIGILAYYIHILANRNRNISPFDTSFSNDGRIHQANGGFIKLERTGSLATSSSRGKGRRRRKLKSKLTGRFRKYCEEGCDKTMSYYSSEGRQGSNTINRKERKANAYSSAYTSSSELHCKYARSEYVTWPMVVRLIRI